MIGSHRRLDDIPFVGLAVALVGGLFFPQWFTPYHALTGMLLQFIFFTSGLRIDGRAIFSEFGDLKLLFVVASLRLVAFPIFVYFVADQFFPSLVVPLVLLAAMPAGMTSPLFVDMVKGNVPLSLLLTAGTSLLSVISIPLVLALLGGDATVYEPLTMFRTLFFIMVVPLLVAQIFRRFSFGRLAIHQGQTLIRVSSILALWLLIAAITSKHSDAIRGSFSSYEAFLTLLIMGVFLVLFQWVAYKACFWRSMRDRITVTLSLSYMNFTLAIFLAEMFFRDSTILLVVILSLLPWNIGLLLFQWLVRYKHWTLHSEQEDREKPAFAG